MKQDPQQPPHEVLRKWLGERDSFDVVAMANGGFSGSRLWRIAFASESLLLRRWPQPGPSLQRVEWIHRVLGDAKRQGFDAISLPKQLLPDSSELRPVGASRTVCECDGYLWDLSAWLPGKALPGKALAKRLLPEKSLPGKAELSNSLLSAYAASMQIDAAMRALGELHTAMAANNTEDRAAVAPGIIARRAMIRRWQLQLFDTASDRLKSDIWPAGVAAARRFVELARRACEPVDRLLAACEAFPVALQPCLRDVWSEHVLFTKNEVTGIIDYGAMRIDHVACDIARLLGSYAGDDSPIWQAGLAAYQDVRRLTEAERQLVEAYDRSTVLLAGLNWVDWIFFQRRQFENLAQVAQRLGHFQQRLEHFLISP